MENFLNGFDISITKTKQGAEASCLLFPNLIGKGKTEEIALENLAKKITMTLTSSIEQLVSKVFKSNNYTEIVFDHTKEVPTQNRFYTMDSSFLATKSFVLKLDQAGKGGQENNKKLLENIISKEFSLLKNLMPNVGSDEQGPTQTLQKLIQNEDEGFSFGFPVSFN